MEQRTGGSLYVATLAFTLLIPAGALAQSGIAGVVKDATGAVLPGVTVEAASPALIEKTRTVVTDDQGQYKIVDLRPGVYAVTFTLVGFSPVTREGIELSAAFTAAVNTEMRVGGVEESITVSGQSPIVDVQNVVQQRVLSREVLDSLPTARLAANSAALIPGVVLTAVSRPVAQDVGGSAGSFRQTMAIHGGRSTDQMVLLDGLPYNAFGCSGACTVVELNDGETLEHSFELGGLSSEAPTGGIRINTIPKAGGNRYEGTFFGTFANRNMQADNITPELRARGLQAANSLDLIWDFNPAFGGPVIKDKLWFFLAYRYWGDHTNVAGMFYNLTPTTFAYTPDYSRQATDNWWHSHAGARLTWQATKSNKFGFYYAPQARVQKNIGVSTTKSPEATAGYRFPTLHLVHATWMTPISTRLLFEAGMVAHRGDSPRIPQPDVPPDILSATELSTGLQTRAETTYGRTIYDHNSYRAVLSLVTGSHAFRWGFSLQHGMPWSRTTVNGDMNLQLLNGVPRSVTVWATPLEYPERFDNLGFFAQDQWTLKRLTFNLGVRLDHFNARTLAQQLPAGQFVPARDFPQVSDVPNWTDLNPRLGVSYDLFGTGRTALKVTMSRYVAQQTTDFARANNPVQTSVNSASRTWTDLNGNFAPNCDFLNPALNGECGPISNTNFGKTNVTTRYDDVVRTGFGHRSFNWETSAALQHELLPGMSVNAAYFRRWYGNFTATDNLLVSPADYNPFCITAPVDPRLPGGGGDQVCGLYDINPAKFGQINNLVTAATEFGKQWEHYNGVDLTVNARLPHGVLLQGGTTTGRVETDNCFVVDTPQQLRYCHVKGPFLTQFKGLGTLALPWNFQASGTFQSIPGPQITGSYVATSAQILPSLGRNLSAGANSTAIVELIPPGTLYDTRLYQVDARLARIFRVGRTQIKGNLDVFNALNASPVILVNTRYGPAWQQPQAILVGRLFKVSVQLNF